MTVEDRNYPDDFTSHIEKNLVKIIENRSGITFDSAKRSELKHDILPLMEDLEIDSYDKYYKYILKDKKRESEIKKLINMVTINETFFFRVEDHFTILKETLIPQILERNEGQKISIWCAGCSSGEEVYSIAITLLELRSKHLKKFDFNVLGTDINDDMITSAKMGIYRGRTLNLVPEPYLERYFDKKNSEYSVKNFVKEKTTFGYLNLTDHFIKKFEKKLDIIFFRNVFIYFNRDTNIKIIDGFHSILKKEGFLFLGPSETLWKLTDKFALLMFQNSYIYQKPGSKGIEINEVEPQIIDKKPENNFQFKAKKNSHIDKMKRVEYPANNSIKIEVKNKPKVDKLSEAEDFINVADYKSAEKIVDDILKNEKTDKDAIILKLLIYSNRSDRSGLLSFSKEINNVIPIFPELHYILGNYFESIGELEQAINLFKKVIFIDRELIQPREKLLNLNLITKNISAAKLEARNLIIQIKNRSYKSFSSRFLPKANIDRLEELCMKIQDY